jgi:hypothetical protein
MFESSLSSTKQECVMSKIVRLAQPFTWDNYDGDFVATS